MNHYLISHIYKSYGSRPVLSDFSAEIPEGKTTCVMGPSGAGKTTLLRLIMGLENPDGGELRGFAGRRMSAVFQEDRLCDNLTPLGNIRLVSPSLPADTVESALSALGLTGCAEQPARELSGGMRRRVALLRALLADHELLLLDEPFKGLDEETKSQTIDYARKCCAGRTVVLVTHDRAEAEAMHAAQVLSLR